MSDNYDQYEFELSIPDVLYSPLKEWLGEHQVRRFRPNYEAPCPKGYERTDGFRCIKCRNSWPYGSEDWAKRTPCRIGVDAQDYLHVCPHCKKPIPGDKK